MHKLFSYHEVFLLNIWHQFHYVIYRFTMTYIAPEKTQLQHQFEQ